MDNSQVYNKKNWSLIITWLWIDSNTIRKILSINFLGDNKQEGVSTSFIGEFVLYTLLNIYDKMEVFSILVIKDKVNQGLLPPLQLLINSKILNAIILRGDNSWMLISTTINIENYMCFQRMLIGLLEKKFVSFITGLHSYVVRAANSCENYVVRAANSCENYVASN